MEAAPELRTLTSGTMLDDKYRIERLLAVGGMGAVYEGTHTQLRKRVAIKVLNPQLASKAMLDRFHREAITASQIGHEGIAQVTDLGRSTSGESFIVMELLEGEPLSGRLRTAKQMPIEVACELGCAILSPLAAAHAAGVVHRDLKPDNVFLVRQSRGEMVKLLDFGISRASGLEQEFRLTTTGLVLGTPYYMSPEQARGETNIGPAADLYSFGVIMYEMLVGEVPIKADNYNQLIYRVMNGDFARPRTKRPDLPPALEDLVMRAMALDPAQRPQTASELEHALLAFCRPGFRDHMVERISHSNLGFKSSSPLLPTPHALATVALQPAKKASKLPIVIAAVAALGIAGAVFAATQRKSEDEPAPAKTVMPSDGPAVVTPPPAPPPPVVEVKAPETITLRFDVEPKTAVIEVDGSPLEGAELEVEKDDEPHLLTITAKGFQPYEEELAFNETQKLVVKLDKIGHRPTVRPKRPKPRPAKNDGKPTIIDTRSPYD